MRVSGHGGRTGTRGLGERIKGLHKEAGWSRAELGDEFGTDSENGRITPFADAVVKLAEVFDVSTDYLLVDDSPGRAFKPAEDAAG